MPDNTDPKNKEPQSGELIKTLTEWVIKDEQLKKSLGRRTLYAILSTSAFVIVAKMILGVPPVSLTVTPLVVITFVAFLLVARAEDWLRGKRPQTFFYLCPDEVRYIPISESVHPIYRKMKSCPHCGCGLIKRCRRGKHFIVSSDPKNPDTPPGPDGFCPFCDSSLPKTDKVYLPVQQTPIK